MPVSSYVIRCSAANQAAVWRELAAIPGVEIGEPTELGFPVAAATDSERAAQELGDHLQQLPGVQAAVLVYHNFEDVPQTP